MAKEYSAYQQKVIKDYYKNQDSIALQKLQELVTELFLAEGKKREKVWDKISNNLEKVGVKPPMIEHLKTKDDPSLLAEFIKTKL